MKKTLHKNRYVENAKDYIYKHLHNVKMFEVYEAVGVNGDYLCRLFKQYEGCSLEIYIRRERIRQAKELLQYLSFSNQSFFTKCFKEETGMTPKEFRESHFG